MGWFDRLKTWRGAPDKRASAISPLHPGDPGLAAFFGWTPAIAGVNVTPENAMQCPPVAACVRLLADTIATVPLEFFRRVNDDTRERAKDDQRFQVMQWPSDWQTGPELRRFLAQSTALNGNGYARIKWRADGMPDQVWPLESRRVTPFRGEGGRVWYRYWPESGQAETIAAGDMIHWRGPWLGGDGLVGASPVDLFRDTIGLAMAQLHYLSRFFANSAMPKGALEIPATLGDKASEVLRESFERRHKGLENAHKLAIFDGGMKFKELGLDHQKSQLVENYQRSVTSIASIFGIPPHMIGEMTQSTSWGTGIEQQAIGFITFVVRPWYVGAEAALNRSLLSAEARKAFYFEHNVDGLLRGDFKSRMDGYALMVQWGLATPNEVRRLMNLPPLPGGDERLQPLNMAPASIVKDVLLKDGPKAERAVRLLLAAVRGEDEDLKNAA